MPSTSRSWPVLTLHSRMQDMESKMNEMRHELDQLRNAFERHLGVDLLSEAGPVGSGQLQRPTPDGLRTSVKRP